MGNALSEEVIMLHSYITEGNDLNFVFIVYRLFIFGGNDIREG
jgi:hypothetical protein